MFSKQETRVTFLPRTVMWKSIGCLLLQKIGVSSSNVISFAKWDLGTDNNNNNNNELYSAYPRSGSSSEKY